TTFDTAWCLLALSRINSGSPSSRMHELVDSLQDTYLTTKGKVGWAIGTEKDVSIPATSLALRALVASDPNYLNRPECQAIWDQMVRAVRNPKENSLPIPDVSAALIALSDPALEAFQTAHSKRAINRGTNWLLSQ